MPDVRTSALLFAAGCTSWIISTFAGTSGSIVLVDFLTYVVRVKTIAPVATIVSVMASPARIITWWQFIEWPVVRWYVPGAIAGAVLGGFLFTRASARGLDAIVGAFLLSTPIQYRLGKSPQSFPMKLQWFVPVSFSVGMISGTVGASSMISTPFYLNYGLSRERMIATGAVHSLFIQVAKIATYGWFGVLPTGAVLEGILAGSGAVSAIVLSRRWLPRFSDVWFRRMTILLMFITGLTVLWRTRTFFG